MKGLATTDWRDDGQAVAPRPCLVQRLEPATRIVLTVLFAAAAVALDDVRFLAAVFGIAIALAAFADLPLRRTALRLAGVELFMVPILLFLPFTVPGEAIVTIGGFPATAAGISQAGAILLTAAAVLLAAMALVGTVEPAILGHGLEHLGAPARLVALLLFTVRYVSVLQEEHARLCLAMKARAFQPAGTVHTWRSVGYLFGMLLVRSFERSERIVAAMKCRGFAGRYVRPDAPAPGVLDAAVTVGMIAVLGGLVIAEALT